jgi:hypothetical protein
MYTHWPRYLAKPRSAHSLLLSMQKTPTCALSIKERNYIMIISPKSLTGHILLGAPSSKTPKEQNSAK